MRAGSDVERTGGSEEGPHPRCDGAPDHDRESDDAPIRAGSAFRRESGLRGAASALIASTLVVAVGCDCERARDRMHESADQGFSQAWDCCKALQELGSPSTESCFLDLKDWRQEITTLIIRWYQACLEGNQSLADSILSTLRRLFADGVGTCGSVVADATGQRRTLGLAIAAGDTAQFEGDLRPMHRKFGGSDQERQGVGAEAWEVGFEVDGTAQVRFADVTASVRLRGAVDLGPAYEQGSIPVRSLALFCEVPGGTELRFTSRGPDASNRLVGPDPEGRATLEVRCAVEVIGALPILVPAEVWLQLPLVERGSIGGYGFGGGKWALRDVLPPAWGFADFNRDGFVDGEDVLAYRRAPAEDRDLDLDGDADEDDDETFMQAWLWGSGAG